MKLIASQTKVLLIIGGVIFLLWSGMFFVLGRASKHVPVCPTVQDRQPAIDSLTARSQDLEVSIALQWAVIDTLRAQRMRAEARRPDVKTRVHDAYASLAVPVDSLASVLLASPDTTR